MATIEKTKIDCNELIVDMDGNPMTANGKEMTVGRIISISLLNDPDKKNPDQTMDLYVTAMNICNAEEYELTDNEIKDIEKALTNTQGKIVAGQLIKYIRDQQLASKAKK